MISLLTVSNGFSEDGKLEGEISLTGKYIGVDAGEGGEAKFTEYRDLERHWGAFGRFRLNYDTEKYFFDLKARDIAYDTQSYKLEGGLWGKLKLDLFYDEIPHNITFDARTFFSGAGGDHLTFSTIGLPETWNTFDYSTERKKYGSGLKFDMIKPFFFNASYFREERDGIKPIGVAATSPGGIGLELPEPVDYVTDNLKLEAGYAKNPLFLSLNYFYSNLNNNNATLVFSNPVTAATDTLTLPPDNRYHRVNFKGGAKLPLRSRFNTNLTYSVTTSDHTFFPTYDGEIRTQNYDFSFTSNPVRFLEAKLFYKYYKRDNRSEQTLITDPEDTPKFLDYRTNTAGLDVGFRLPFRFYLNGGYKYVRTSRDLEGETNPDRILPDNKDNVYAVELRWNGLDFLTTKVGYERLDRNADFAAPVLNRRFAYAEQDRDSYKLSIDLFPIENLNIGLGFQHRDADYDEGFGLKEDKRDEIDVSADYLLGRWARVYAFSDYGWVKFFQSQRSNTPAGNWDAKQREKTFDYGVGTEVFIIPQKLTVVLHHDYVKSNGSVDLTLDPALFVAATGLAGANNEIVDIINWDDYRKWSVKIKTIYQFTKSLSASVGYVYERFRYSDVQLDNYQFVPAAAGTNGAYLTGAFKDLSYKANIVFGGMTYKF